MYVKSVYFQRILHKIAPVEWIMMHIITKAYTFGSTYKNISDVFFFVFFKKCVKDGYHGNNAKQAFRKVAMISVFERTYTHQSLIYILHIIFFSWNDLEIFSRSFALMSRSNGNCLNFSDFSWKMLRLMLPFTFSYKTLNKI